MIVQVESGPRRSNSIDDLRGTQSVDVCDLDVPVADEHGTRLHVVALFGRQILEPHELHREIRGRSTRALGDQVDLEIVRRIQPDVVVRGSVETFDEFSRRRRHAAIRFPDHFRCVSRKR